MRNLGNEERVLATDSDAVDPAAIDLKKLEFVEMEMSPALQARIRARRVLRQLTIRLSAAQLEAVREIARKQRPAQRAAAI